MQRPIGNIFYTTFMIRVLPSFLSISPILAFGDADEQPGSNFVCPPVQACNPPCVLDVSGPCNYCDCQNRCPVSCSGTNCKIYRNNGYCSCSCNGGGGGGNVCAIACPPGCRVVNENGQCRCVCY
ncbi:hypothetical protein NPIL_327861 [Nephila pilipes]|uniref:Spider venom protein n=1 Tax=Nephila pilipes TaxID=299642 RepID=A0A8X6QZP6_NEPPI|nr:hypothetical protein NPIL_327861 [Nephila pilipes]